MNNLLSLPALAFHELTLFENSSLNRSPISYKQSVLAKAFYPLVGLISGTVLFLIHKSIDSVLPENIADLFIIVGMAFFSNGKHLVGLTLTLQKLFTWKPTQSSWKFLERLFKTPPSVGITIIIVLWLWIYGLSLAPFNFKNQIILIIPVVCNWGIVLLNFDNTWKSIKKSKPENDNTVSKKESLSALALAFALTFASFGFLLKLNGILILLIITLFIMLFIKATSSQRRDLGEPALSVIHEFSGIIFLFLARYIL